MLVRKTVQQFGLIPNQPKWSFEVGDWITSSSWMGLIDHHMRVTQRLVDSNSVRWYQVFDTTVTRGYADYEWVLADKLESESRLVIRPYPEYIPAILHRAAHCQHLVYSVPARMDCESVQRWIQTGLEQFRWSGQVWTGILTVAGSIIVAAVTAEQRPKGRQRFRKRR
jgi:hypothetical protein